MEPRVATRPAVQGLPSGADPPMCATKNHTTSIRSGHSEVIHHASLRDKLYGCLTPGRSVNRSFDRVRGDLQLLSIYGFNVC